MMQVTSPDVNYVHDFEFAQGSQWGAVVLHLAQREGLSGMLVDPKPASLMLDGHYPKGSVIRLTGRMYTDVQLGKLDGPGRYIVKDDPFKWTSKTPKASLTKRQRRKLRKLRRKAKRNGESFDEMVTIAVITA